MCGRGGRGWYDSIRRVEAWLACGHPELDREVGFPMDPEQHDPVVEGPELATAGGSAPEIAFKPIDHGPEPV